MAEFFSPSMTVQQFTVFLNVSYHHNRTYRLIKNNTVTTITGQHMI